MDETSSRQSESVAIHKLGFDVITDMKRPFASIINRVSLIPSSVTIILQVIGFIQFAAYGSACIVPDVLNDTNASIIFKCILVFFQRFFFDTTSDGAIIGLLFAYIVILLSWLILYWQLNSHYSKHRVFSRTLVKILHFIGVIVIPIIIPPMSSTCCFFIRPLIGITEESVNIYSFLGIATYFGYFYITNLIIECVQSSPTMDIKNMCCMWPTECFLLKFRFFFLLIFGFVAELFEMIDSCAAILITVLGMIGGIIGFIFVWTKDCYILQIGKTIGAAEYIVIFSFSLFMLIHSIIEKFGFYLLLTAIVLSILLVVAESRIQYYFLKKDIDIIYLPFEEMIEKITTPEKCIHLLKLGLVYTVPCILNQMLPNWCLTRWPSDQDLMIFCLFLSFLQHAPYMEVLEMLNTAVDIKPFSVFQDLLAYQIFVRLPTQENKLKMRLERIRKLYEIPEQHLQHFWSAVTRRHWDEAYIYCCHLNEETKRIFNMFTNLIFENPNYDFVMIEFRHFVEEIMGNNKLANAIEQEITRRKLEIKISSALTTQDTVSLAQLTRASSVRSTIFLSEFSDTQTPIEKNQTSIYSSIEARPIYSPRRFVGLATILTIFGALLVIVLLLIVKGNNTRMSTQTQLAIELQTLSETIGRTLLSTLEFSGINNMTDSYGGVDPSGSNITLIRNNLNELTLSIDTILSNAFYCHSVLPASFLRDWTDQSVGTYVLSPSLEKINASFIDILHLLQVRARAVSFTPESDLGYLNDPSLEIQYVSLLFPSACEAIYSMTSKLSILVADNCGEMRTMVEVLVISIFVIGFVANLISCIYLSFFIRKELNFFLDIYSFIPIKVLQRLANPNENNGNSIAVNDESDAQTLSHLKQEGPPFTAYQIPHIIITFLILYILLGIPSILLIISHNIHLTQATTISSGYEISSKLVLTVSKLYLSAYRIITGFPSPYNTPEEMKLLMDDLNIIIYQYQSLLYGNDDRFQTGMIVSRPNEVVTLLYETCQAITDNRTINGLCTSFDTDINFVYSHIQRLLSYSDEYIEQGVIGGWWQLFYPVMNKLIVDEMPKFKNVFYEFAINVRSSSSVFEIISIVICILFLIGIPLLTYLVSFYVMTPNFLLLLKPIILMPLDCIADSQFLLHFLQGDYDRPNREVDYDKNKNDGNSSTPLIDFILEGVLILSPDGTIIGSNRKYNEMVLTSQEEILGVPIKNLFNNEHMLPIFDAIEKLREGSTTPFQTISIETMIFSSDDRELDVKMTLVAQTKFNGKYYRATSLALIITDKSELIKAQTQLRKEKANVEELLDQILPHIIAVSLLNGQTDISFNVEKASIMFVDIVSFIPLCASKTAKEVITTLNCLFTEFDSALGLASRVTKLKTIGDIYVCAAGLFEGDGSVEETAKEIVKLGLTMIDIVPEVNHQLSQKLQIRIGIHTGGPLICGVLGKEKPLFEAIGNVVTIAEELENTSLPGRIHISQDTADLISSLELKLQERGNDITISGLNNQHTYIVLPPAKEKDS